MQLLLVPHDNRHGARVSWLRRQPQSSIELDHFSVEARGLLRLLGQAQRMLKCWAADCAFACTNTLA
jgi:hypothetical protein